MLLLVNSTKLMDLRTPAPSRLRVGEPFFAEEAAALVARLRKLRAADLARTLDLSEQLADRVRVDLARWGEAGNSSRPAWYAFTGLVYQGLDPRTLDAAARGRARRRLRILSGLYGLLGPFDRGEAYRLEMGCRFKPPRSTGLVSFWKDRLTEILNAELRPGEAVLSVASQEYVKALDLPALRGPVVTPVFKEVRPDGSLKTVPVYAKTARGSLLRHALVSGARRPRDLLNFAAHDWEATCEPPEAGPWLFTRPVRE